MNKITSSRLLWPAVVLHLILTALLTLASITHQLRNPL